MAYLRSLSWPLRAVFVTMILAGILAGLVWSERAPEILPYVDRTRTVKPLLRAHTQAVVTGTPWATDAALAVLRAGGRACDAAVTALLVLNVTHGEAAAFPGVAPTMYYEGRTGRVRSYIGAGTAPRRATAQLFRDSGDEVMPALDIRTQLVPASPDVLTALLRDCGSLSFRDAAAPAIHLAKEGFPAHPIIVRNLDLSLINRLGYGVLLPYNARVWLQGRRFHGLTLHERLTFPDLAESLQTLVRAEERALRAGSTRAQALDQVRDEFYRGSIAQKILNFHQTAGGLFTAADLAEYSGGWETPLVAPYRDLELHTNGTWSQGIVALMALRTLEGLDLRALGHNSAAYVHTVVQAIDLAMADRDACVADPAFVPVPTARLLSAEYAARQRSRITARAFAARPASHAGCDFARSPATARARRNTPAQGTAGRVVELPAVGQDTTQLVIVDRAGDAIVMTPSDFPKTPMIPGTGLTLGDRMTQFRLDANSPNRLEPGKRPRITPHAIIVTKNGGLRFAFSTPGGDMQAQALLQVFLNVEVFGMNVQDAVSAPRFYSVASESSFSPHESRPRVVRLESDVFAAVAAPLRALDYLPEENPRLDKDFGAVGIILRQPRGALLAGADPREETTAAGD